MNHYKKRRLVQKITTGTKASEQRASICLVSLENTLFLLFFPHLALKDIPSKPKHTSRMHRSDFTLLFQSVLLMLHLIVHKILLSIGSRPKFPQNQVLLLWWLRCTPANHILTLWWLERASTNQVFCNLMTF